MTSLIFSMNAFFTLSFLITNSPLLLIVSVKWAYSNKQLFMLFVMHLDDNNRQTNKYFWQLIHAPIQKVLSENTAPDLDLHYLLIEHPIKVWIKRKLTPDKTNIGTGPFQCIRTGASQRLDELKVMKCKTTEFVNNECMAGQPKKTNFFLLSILSSKADRRCTKSLPAKTFFAATTFVICW